MRNSPVKRKLVASPADWPWSSWCCYNLGDKSILEIDRLDQENGQLAMGNQGFAKGFQSCKALPPTKRARGAALASVKSNVCASLTQGNFEDSLEIPSMPPILGAATSALTGIKTVTEIIKNVRDTKDLSKLNDIYAQLIDVREKIIELQQENHELHQELHRLNTDKTIQSQLIVENQVYYRMVDGKKDGPFCPLCWDDKHKLVRTQTGVNNEPFCNLHKVSFDPGLNFFRQSTIRPFRR